jgi:hypothetical protein
MPFSACRHLQRQLEQLDGRSCLGPPPPFQVLTAACRLTFHGSTPLDEELRREFAADAEETAKLLARLRTIGEGLETALQLCGGLPLTGFAARCRFAWQRLRRGLTSRTLSRPLSRQFAHLGAESREALITLFTGLSLLPAERLTVAEAALLWSTAATAPGIAPQALAELLHRRFEQFHGEQAALAELESVQATAGRIESVTLRGGRRCSAPTFILASPGAARRLPEPSPALPDPSLAPTAAASVVGSISPLLAPTVILGGSPPLHLELAAQAGVARVGLSLPRQLQPPTATQLQHRLDGLFPFTDVRLAAGPALSAPAEPPSGARSVKAFPGAASLLTIGPNLLLCSGRMVLPHLGPTGEVLVAATITELILRQNRP